MAHKPNPKPLIQIFEEHFGNKTPYELLGVGESANHAEVRKAFFGKMAEIAGKSGKAVEDTQALLKGARDILFNPSLRENLDQWMKAKAEQASQTIHTAKLYTFPGTQQTQERLNTIKKFPINKPLVAIGATVVALCSATLAVKATETIRHKKDNGENPSQSDRTRQVLGVAGVAGIISAAALMWKATKGPARS